MTAQTPERDGGGERDLQAEQDHAEWLGWAEANGYDPEGRCGMAGENAREAFLAGMAAARDNGDWFEVNDDQDAEIARLNGLLRDDRRSLGRIWREPQNATEIADERLTALEHAGVRAENPGEPR